MFRILTGGLAARLASYGVIGLGFWLLYRAFGSEAALAGIAWGVGGGALILAGMFLLVSVGRAGGFSQGTNHDPIPSDTPGAIPGETRGVTPDFTTGHETRVDKEEGRPS